MRTKNQGQNASILAWSQGVKRLRQFQSATRDEPIRLAAPENDCFSLSQTATSPGSKRTEPNPKSEMKGYSPVPPSCRYAVG
jgi:hypothetical protein